MKHLFKSAVIAAVLAAAPAFADPVKMNAVTLAPKPVYINGPFKSFVEEVNEKFAGKIEINWRGGPEVMPPFQAGRRRAQRCHGHDLHQPKLLSGSGANVGHNEFVVQDLR